MSKVLFCIASFALANFGVEAVMHDIPNYEHALETTWNQAWAIGIYYFIWVKE